MAENSAIEWTHHTFNSWRGCTKISAGCTNCYAETMSLRNPAALGIWGVDGARAIASESYWKHPFRWNAEAERQGQRRRVFCASMADVFEGDETMPEAARVPVAQARARLWKVIEDTPWLDWLILTKRPENIARMVPLKWGADPEQGIFDDSSLMPPNVWIGTSVENQEQADKRIPELLKVPARVRFLSCEPLLGPVDLDQAIYGPQPRDGLSCFGFTDGFGYEASIHWVIVGGESGPSARPMHPEWARSLRDQCQAAGVAFHFKQWGEWAQYNHYGVRGKGGLPYFSGNATRRMDDGFLMERYGKKAAGRLLDGCTWNEFPA